ncbi:MAG: radical SAM protein [Proteobacteria bacterium]|nr:radical SAM protein [Pseudomonadota bacterium]
MNPDNSLCNAEDAGLGQLAICQRLLRNHPYPLFAGIELTHRCNLNCPHCYVPPNDIIQELLTDEIINLLDQLAEMGVITLTFSGGEPTVRSDLFDIIKAAVDRRFVVILKSNLARISCGDVEELARVGLYELNGSLYHLSPEAHDRFVGQSGAWQHTVDALRVFKAKGRNVSVALIAMNWNRDGIANLEDFCRAEGWAYSVDFRIEPRSDGDLSPTRYQAKPSDLVSVIENSHLLSKIAIRGGAFRPADDAQVCGMGRVSVVIRPDGTVIPCVSLPGITLGNIREKKLLDIWSASKIRKSVTNLRWGHQVKCAECEFIVDCRRCPATGFIEHGSLTTPSTLDCELAEVWHRARTRLEQDGT